MPRAKFHQLSHAAARELIWSRRVNGGGRIFGVAFDRLHDRADDRALAGDREVVYCRFNVRQHLTRDPDGSLRVPGWIHPDGAVRSRWVRGARPAGAAYDRANKDVFCVFVTNRKANSRGNKGSTGYRCIKFSTVRWLKLDGITYRVGAPPPKQH